MREIKFRAWHDKDKEMVCFKNDRLVNDQYQMQHLAHLINGDYGDVLMQFTGLKDKNGVELYDRDIIQSLHFIDHLGVENYLRFVVRWSESFKGWVAVMGDGTEMQIWVYAEFKVIGNIHENPELLK